MNRASWLQAIGPLLFLPALAGCASASPPKGMSPVYPIPLLQTVESTATRSTAWVNGFSADWLLSVRADASGQVAGLATRMLGYAGIHPYFLRPGANELRVDYTADAAGRLNYRVAALAYLPGKDLGTVFAEQALLSLGAAPAEALARQQVLTGTFEWSGVPAWAWTRAPAIADTAENRQGLQAAVEHFRAGLEGLAGQPAAAAALAQSSRASMQEFIQASELRGRPFTLLDQLFTVASTLMLPGDKSPEAFLADRHAQARARQGQPPRRDDAMPHPPVARLPDGQLPPRLSLRKLDSFDGLAMQLFAGGRLARLADKNGEPVIQFVSNYSDGPRGSPRPVRFVCDAWFRQNGRQQWELDAIYPTQATHQVLGNPWPQELLEQQPY